MTKSNLSSISNDKTFTVLGDTFFRTKFIPLFLMLTAPPGVQFLWVACFHYNGDLSNVLSTSLSQLWSNFPSSTYQAAIIACGFLIFQLLLLLILPGKTFLAIPTPMGNRPRYYLNGVLAFFVTHLTFLYAEKNEYIRMAVVYDCFGPMLAFLNITALVVTVLLYIRGIYCPTNSDSGTTGFGIIWDMWHGTELHPEIFGVSLKQLINCRFAMMGWSVAIVAFALKQKELYGYVSNSMLVSLTLQTLYIFKFFCWEGGYFNSVDIIHDRFGFYIFWGCSAFLPSVYTLTSYFLTNHPVILSLPLALLITSIGIMALICNYWTDRQRQIFREKNGQLLIWGKKPVIIKANYTTGDGKPRQSLLLASGWWGIARHINYVFELTLAYCWCLPALGSGLLAYFYAIFLTILLVDRAYRDEIRCAEKYGKFYDEYCAVVRWRMIPGVY